MLVSSRQDQSRLLASRRNLNLQPITGRFTAAALFDLSRAWTRELRVGKFILFSMFLAVLNIWINVSNWSTLLQQHL